MDRVRWIPGWGRALTAAGMDPAQATYLHPITRRLNPNFKGVIFVDGKVGPLRDVSGGG